MAQQTLPDNASVQMLFIRAWAACENPELDSENPHFRNRYASLRATLKVVRNACKPFGIMYLQKLVKNEDGSREFRSSILSEFGEELALSTFPVECPPNPQSFGSNVTYAKRQQAQADWGITGEEDDDGNAAAEYASAKPANPRNHPLGNTTGKAQAAQPDKKKWLTRCLQLKAQCMAQGVKESGLDGWYKASFGDVQPSDLTIEQVTEWGKYLAQIAKDSDHGKEDTDEHQQSDD